MADNDTALAAFHRWHDDRIAIAAVISTWGSAPRPRGSHMLVNADDRMEGPVSGGRVEADVLELAADVIATGRAEPRRYGVADEAAWWAAFRAIFCATLIICAVSVVPSLCHSRPISRLLKSDIRLNGRQLVASYAISDTLPDRVGRVGHPAVPI